MNNDIETIRKETYDSILKLVQLKDNAVNTNFIVFEDILTEKRICKYVLTINGHELGGEVVIRKDNLYSDSNVVWESIAKNIANHIVNLIKVKSTK